MIPSAQPFPFLEALEPRLAPAGIVAVDVKGGVLSITGDSEGENNHVQIYDAGNGVWGIRDGGGDGTTFSLNGAAAQTDIVVTVSGGVKIDLKGGNDILTFDGVKVGGPITLKDSAGNDTVNFSNTVVNGTIKLDTGNGDDRIYVSDSTFNNSISMKTGAGDDTVDLNRGTYRSITADLGTGINNFDLLDSEAGGAISVFGDVSITSKGTAESSDNIYMGAENFLIVGSLKVKGGLYDSSFSLNDIGDQGNALITGNLSYHSAGNVNSSSQITFGSNITIGGKAEFKINKGDGDLRADGVNLTLGSLSYTGGKGGNLIDFAGQSLTIAGDAVFNLGASAVETGNYVSFYTEVNMFIGGNFTFKGGKENNSLDLNSADVQILGVVSFTAGAGTYNQMRIDCATGILGSVVYKGGAGEDEMFIGEGNYLDESLSILGKMTVDLGKTASNYLFLSDATIYGAVSIAAGTNQPAEDSAELTLDIIDSTFLSSLTLKTSGTQGADINLRNSTFMDAFSLTTGSGNDVVHLDTEDAEFGNQVTRNIFEGPVKIVLGAGDDLLIAGVLDGEGDEGNLFNGSVFLDGGPGEDFANNAPNRGNVYLGTLTEKNFEPQVA